MRITDADQDKYRLTQFREDRILYDQLQAEWYIGSNAINTGAMLLHSLTPTTSILKGRVGVASWEGV